MQFLALDIEDILRSLWASLCQFIYVLVAWLYDLFMNLSRVQILNEDTIKPIYQRFTLILTIVMVFYVTFEVVKYVIEPETFSDKEKGGSKLVMKMILVVILIAFVPRIFALGDKFQNLIFDNQVFSKVVLGQQQVDTNKFGRIFSSNVLGMFYTTNKEWGSKELENQSNCEGIPCAMVVNMNLSTLATHGSLDLLHFGLNGRGKMEDTATGENVHKYYIRFDGLLAVGVGVFLVYILLIYCIDVGVRIAQLAFLQIIAPIPIIGYLSPKKEGIFQKWVKQCFTTYLDLFIRVGIIYFVLLVCQILGDAYANGSLLNNLPGDTSSMMKIFIYIALIMGLLLFAKKAPQMLSELFPKMGAASGNFGLNGKSRVEPTLNAAKRIGRVAGGAAGGLAGAVTGAATGIAQGARRARALKKDGTQKGVGAGIWGASVGAIGGLVGGATRGAYNGSKKGNIVKNIGKGISNQNEANKRFGNKQESGYTVGHQIEDRTRAAFGFDSRSQNVEKSKAPISQESETLKKIDSTRKQVEERALSKMQDGKGGVQAQNYAQQTQRLKDLQENQAVREREFRVGKYSDANAARTAYENDVALAKSTVNKSNFINQSTGAFDAVGYNKACAAAAAKVDASKYTVAYSTQAAADAAYASAIATKQSGIDRSMFATEAEYNAALAAAAAEVNKDMYIQGYTSQADADTALAEEIKKQQKEVDKAKDAAVQEYVKDSGDAAIDSMLQELNTTVKEYNISASDERRILYKDENSKSRNADDIDVASIKEDFLTFSDVVKGSKQAYQEGDAPGTRTGASFKERQNKNEQEIISKNAEIERIKNETSGSGIGEGKK